MRVITRTRGLLVLAAIALAVGGCLPSAVRPTPTPPPTPEPTATPTPTPTPTPGPPTPTPAPTFKLHTVVRGDTLTSLARRYHTTGRSIAYWNRERYPSLDPESAGYQPDNLKRGWILQVMPGKEYVPPADDGETGEQVTPEPDDLQDFETPPADAEASPGASLGGWGIRCRAGILGIMSAATARSPRILVTLAVAARQIEPALAARKNALYVDCMLRHGATVMHLDAASSPSARAAAFASMDGLLLTGGADLDPARYGAADAGSVDVEQDRDELEAAAFAAAESRGVPVLGICRGLQAMNVFSGGTLLQHVDGHAGAGWGHGAALTHPLRLVPGSRLARILNPTNAGGAVVTVNSYHHQAVRAADLAPAYAPSAWSPSRAGELVEAFEAPSGPFRMAVQCHPERTESTPRAFERLFAFFVDTCRGPLTGR